MISYDQTVAQKDIVLEIFVSMEIKSIGLNEEKKNLGSHLFHHNYVINVM